ncbi:winged helix-turn-helix domain-containing protein [Clostridiaceae bacterium UIB06]|uniref:Winged helix-turn-helix domain-containing protein n=1 Tax=Clostridium thailandense TaxID=2794346 RepID=A0A949TVQ8_9CLOT|nr:winged helix-turn-helix domain-containing protein [Clostridium thailandense]MCH5136871.1 winged helix-turn-helix domain-containing protein [Clostridiaceae bacterium UIB06]
MTYYKYHIHNKKIRYNIKLIIGSIKSKSSDINTIGHRWTSPLLAEYINQTYGVLYSDETIRRILISENYTFKRAQAKPSKADKAEQEGF